MSLIAFVHLWLYFVLFISSPIARPTFNDSTAGFSVSVRKVDAHRYSYVINQEKLCKNVSTDNGQILLFIGVCSAVEHRHMRDAIRETWGHVVEDRRDVRLAFMLGRVKNESIQRKVIEEAKAFGDVIQEDFTDSYFNLSLKSVMLLKWVYQYCPRALFVLKTDDDMFINSPNLLKYLNAIRDKRWQLFGHLNHGTKPNRSRASKRFPLLANYKQKIFPEYLAGGAYAMSGDVARILYKASLRTPLFRVEDVYITGLVANVANVPRIDHGSFKVDKNMRECYYRNAISGHGFEADELRRVWTRLWKKCK